MVYIHTMWGPASPNLSSDNPVQLGEFTKSIEHFLVLILNTHPHPTLSHYTLLGHVNGILEGTESQDNLIHSRIIQHNST